MQRRTPIPKKIEKTVFQRFSSRCPFCDENDIATLQIHHIEPYSEVKKHDLENLILVCSNCHNRIHSGDIPLAAIKRKMENVPTDNDQNSPSNIGVSVQHAVNNGIIAQNISVNVPKGRRPPVTTLSGTISAEGPMRNYAKHLIDRYHEFKKAEVGKGNMNYAVLYSAIKRKFGAKWDHVPQMRFPDLTIFLQDRIDKTILGKNRKSKGISNYSTYEKYLSKYGGEPR